MATAEETVFDVVGNQQKVKDGNSSANRYGSSSRPFVSSKKGNARKPSAEQLLLGGRFWFILLQKIGADARLGDSFGHAARATGFPIMGSNSTASNGQVQLDVVSRNG